jgi:hypothetical protein
MSSFKRYYISATSYCGFRKTIQLWDAKVPTEQRPGLAKRDLLMGEKLGIFVATCFISPAIAPIALLDDMNRLDIYMKNEDPKKYGYAKPKNAPYDYLLC